MTAPGDDPILIHEFVERYKKEFDFYEQAAKLAAQLVEARLKTAGIRSIVTSRAKDPARLGEKLQSRARERQKGYGSVTEIYDDIPDFAGVRIALYFPEQSRVGPLIDNDFSVLVKKEFPITETVPPAPHQYRKRFSGYVATHYRVTFLPSVLAERKRYTEAKIEIQVATVLMHAWAEVEHDLVYKPLQGSLSEGEYDILDELNGLVLTGEIALKRLQAAAGERVAQGKQFANHYELAAFVLSRMGRGSDQGLGEVDMLYGLLVAAKKASPTQLDPYLSQVHPDLEKRQISEQVIDLLLADDSTLYAAYNRIREQSRTSRSDSKPDVVAALGFFTQQWIEFESCIRQKLSPSSNKSPPAPSPSILRSMGIIDEGTFEILEPIRRLRNSVVHGLYTGPPETLVEAAQRLQEVNRQLAIGPR